MEKTHARRNIWKWEVARIKEKFQAARFISDIYRPALCLLFIQIFIQRLDSILEINFDFFRNLIIKIFRLIYFAI